MPIAEEQVLVVDRNNRVVGEAARGAMRRLGLAHRAAFIVVFNGAGELFVHRRTASKEVYPGYYDVAAGGVVLAGETYRQAAARELAEELGVRPRRLARHGDFYHRDGANRVWGRVFSCVHDGPLILQAEEVAWGGFLAPQQLEDLRRRAPFTPDGLRALDLVRAGRAARVPPARP